MKKNLTHSCLKKKREPLNQSILTKYAEKKDIPCFEWADPTAPTSSKCLFNISQKSQMFKTLTPGFRMNVYNGHGLGASLKPALIVVIWVGVLWMEITSGMHYNIKT